MENIKALEDHNKFVNLQNDSTANDMDTSGQFLRFSKEEKRYFRGESTIPITEQELVKEINDTKTEMGKLELEKAGALKKSESDQKALNEGIEKVKLLSKAETSLTENLEKGLKMIEQLKQDMKLLMEKKSKIMAERHALKDKNGDQKDKFDKDIKQLNEVQSQINTREQKEKVMRDKFLEMREAKINHKLKIATQKLNNLKDADVATLQKELEEVNEEQKKLGLHFNSKEPSTEKIELETKELLKKFGEIQKGIEKKTADELAKKHKMNGTSVNRDPASTNNTNATNSTLPPQNRPQIQPPKTPQPNTTTNQNTPQQAPQVHPQQANPTTTVQDNPPTSSPAKFVRPIATPTIQPNAAPTAQQQPQQAQPNIAPTAHQQVQQPVPTPGSSNPVPTNTQSPPHNNNAVPPSSSPSQSQPQPVSQNANVPKSEAEKAKEQAELEKFENQLFGPLESTQSKEVAGILGQIKLNLLAERKARSLQLNDLNKLKKLTSLGQRGQEMLQISQSLKDLRKKYMGSLLI